MLRTWHTLLPEPIRKKIEGRPNLQKVMSNTGWLISDKIVRMGAGLFVGAWLARYLGPAQYGTFNYCLAFAALFLPLANLGLERITVRNIVCDPSNKNELLGTVFVLKFFGGIVTLLLTIGLISFIRPADVLMKSLVGIASIGTVVQAFDTIDYWFQSQVLSKFIVYARTTSFLAVSLVKVVLILASAPLIAFVLSGVAEAVFAAAGLAVFYAMNRETMRAWRFNFSHAQELLKESWPLIFSGISIMVYMKIDQVMIGELAGNKAVGIYSAVAKISELWYFIPLAVVSSVFPAIIKTKEFDETIYYARLQKLFYGMSAIALSIAVPMTFFSSAVMSVVFGKGFTEGGPVLAVHIWGSLFVFLGIAQGSWDVAENLTRLSLLRTSAGALINIVLNIFLIPRYQAMGAAAATVISYACSAYLLNAFHRKTRIIFIQQTKSLFFINAARSFVN